MGEYKTVLLVDDDEAFRFLARDALENAAVCEHIEEASDGMIAFEKIKRDGVPGFIFLDLRMPRMDGFEFLEEIHREGLDKGAKIAVLSSSTREEDERRAASYPCVLQYFEKPLTSDGIFELIERIVKL